MISNVALTLLKHAKLSYIHTNNASHYYKFSLISIPIFPTFFLQIMCANWKISNLYQFTSQHTLAEVLNNIKKESDRREEI